MADTNELKPCPFCGSKNVMAFARTCNKDSKYNPADRAFPIVRCRECGACSEGRDWSEPITAITKWNERATKATPPADAALADALEAASNRCHGQDVAALRKAAAALRARPQAVPKHINAVYFDVPAQPRSAYVMGWNDCIDSMLAASQSATGGAK